ncbi:MAG: hypothetical protein L0H83_02325 [Salinisphaera sp.]|nr:hypothetical protein [Salinisphaera sp.]
MAKDFLMSRMITFARPDGQSAPGWSAVPDDDSQAPSKLAWQRSMAFFASHLRD